MTGRLNRINLVQLIYRHSISHRNGSRLLWWGKSTMTDKGQKVRLNELGLRFYVSKNGAPKRRSREWGGRLGVVAAVTKDRTRARIIWDGNRSMADVVPTKFLEDVSQPRSAPTNEANYGVLSLL
jgi:hypothetical protein